MTASGLRRHARAGELPVAPGERKGHGPATAQDHGTRQRLRGGFAVQDLAVVLACAVVAGALLVPMLGASRDLSKAQVCSNNLRMLFTGMTLYVNQYNSYPPHAPYPTYMAPEIVNGVSTMGWDPNIGFILTHGLALQPPATDSATGHFQWYGTAFADLPDVCKCPAMPAALLDPANPEVADPLAAEPSPLETVLYQYALSYQTSATCRAACPLVYLDKGVDSAHWAGGRNPPIPDPTLGLDSGQQADNMQRGISGVWCLQHDWRKPPGDPTDSGEEYNCWIQAVHPAEVQSPGRVYYLADSRDYRPQPKGTAYDEPPAGYNNGWYSGWGEKVFLGTRHFEYANVLYLDGRVSRGNETHSPYWNMVYNPAGGPGQSNQWRMSTFATCVPTANVQTQVHIMPVLCVRGWEYFFDVNGMLAK